MHVSPVFRVREYTMRSEETQHPIERVDIQARLSCGLLGRRTRVANDIGYSGVRDDVETARGDVRLREISDQVGRSSLRYCRMSRFWISHSPFTLTIVSS